MDRKIDVRIFLAAAGLVIVIAVCSVLGLVLIRDMSARILAREAVAAQEFLDGILAADGSSSESLFATPAPSPALVAFSANLRHLPNMARINVYALDAFIRYSTEANLVGLKFADNPELVASFAGSLISKIDHVNDEDKPEHLALNRFSGDELIEIYVPVHDEKDRIVAVVEFYKKPQAVKKLIGDMESMVRISVALAGIALFLAFCAVLLGFPARSAKP